MPFKELVKVVNQSEVNIKHPVEEVQEYLHTNVEEKFKSKD